MHSTALPARNVASSTAETRSYAARSGSVSGRSRPTARTLAVNGSDAVGRRCRSHHRQAIASLEPALKVDTPSNAQNLSHAVELDAQFWVEHYGELTRRFNAWLDADNAGMSALGDPRR